MIVFISYASEHRAIADEIALALRGEGYEVFLDRSALPEGDAYNARIREAIEGCDLFVFLLSPEAVAPGRYTLTELKFAEKKWSSPVGHVLPVLVQPTDKAAIPAYLRAVVVLSPSGNVAAEVVVAVNHLVKPRWIQVLRRHAAWLIALAVLGLAAAGWRAYDRWRSCGDAARLVQEAELQQQAGDYAAAWARYADALLSCPGSDEAEVGQEHLAMVWLDNVRPTAGKETFTDVVNEVQPALSRGAVAPDDGRAADALAHLGWADFLRGREGAGGLNPVRYYQQAIARDPRNPFAHAMWAHHILWAHGSIDEAKGHFSEALASGRERTYVRNLELYGFLSRRDPAGDNEVLRVVNEMRLQGEALPAGTPNDSITWRVWDVYYRRLVRGEDRAGFLAAVSPKDQLATITWLFPQGVVPEDKRPLYLFMLAQIQENGGDRVEALATYESLVDLLAVLKWDSAMGPEAKEAIKRLRKE